MSKSNFSEEFKRDAVRQITERGYPVAEVSQRLVDAEPSDNGCRAAGVADGCLEAKAKGKGSGAFGSGIAIHQHGLGSVPEAPQSGSFDEPTGQLP